MPLKKVRLELARNSEFPEGSPDHGYEFNAPLDADGYISVVEWKKRADDCTVRRFWGKGIEEHGKLVRVKEHWMFDYLQDEDDDDEPIFRMSIHRFVPGEYVSITEHDGVQRAFKVASVTASPLT